MPTAENKAGSMYLQYVQCTGQSDSTAAVESFCQETQKGHEEHPSRTLTQEWHPAVQRVPARLQNHVYRAAGMRCVELGSFLWGPKDYWGQSGT